MSPLSGLVTAAGSDPTTYIQAPSIAYAALMPIFIVLGAALLGVLFEALLPRDYRYPAQLTLTILALVAALLRRFARAPAPAPAEGAARP